MTLDEDEKRGEDDAELEESSTKEPPSPPREVPSWVRSSVARVLIILGLVFALVSAVGTGVVYVSVGSAAHDEALDARGKRAMATAVNYRLVATTSGHQVKIHDIDLEFQDANGKKQRTTITQTDTSQLDAVKTAKKLQIEYDPQDASAARWPGTRLSPFGTEVYWLGAAVSVIGVLIMLLGWFLALRDRHLYRNGQARLGRVDRVEPFVENRKTNYYVDYSYKADKERVQSTWVARGTAQPEKGPIWVIVAAGNPYRSIPMLSNGS